MKIFLVILSILLLSNQQVDEIFIQSNNHYTNGNYEAALDGYLEIINSGFESSELYFNLGNTFYKLNNIPESNFYFEKALAISPNDFDVITNLGPCFIKLGQALSTRPDLVRQDWLTELTNLQDNLPPFEHKIALKIIEDELGLPANELFDDFPDEPIASASLGIVYKAKTKTNNFSKACY